MRSERPQWKFVSCVLRASSELAQTQIAPLDMTMFGPQTQQHVKTLRPGRHRGPAPDQDEQQCERIGGLATDGPPGGTGKRSESGHRVVDHVGNEV